MKISFPLTLVFEIKSFTETVFVASEGGRIISHRNLKLLLRTDNQQIQLKDAKPISEYEVSFVLSTNWKTGKEVYDDLNEDEIGYLSYLVDKGNPYIHGRLIWPHEWFINGFFQPHT